jgi:hypothetical protein
VASITLTLSPPPPPTSWAKLYSNGTDFGSVKQTADGGYVAGGVGAADPAVPAGSTAWLVKVNADGSAAGEHAYAPAPGLLWSVTGGGTIDGAGRFTAGASAGGPYTVTVSYGTLTASAGFVVGTMPSTPTAVLVSPSFGTAVMKGGTRQFTGTVVDQTGQPVSPQPALTWTVSGGGTIDATGLFTAGDPVTLGNGPFLVTASGAGLSGTAGVEIVIFSGATAPGALRALALAPDPAVVPVGGSLSFTATGSDDAGTAVPLPPATAADLIRDVWPTSDGGYAFSGGQSSATLTDFYLAKVKPDFSVDWETNYLIHLSTSDLQAALAGSNVLAQTLDGDYAIAGGATVLKVDSSGTPVWNRWFKAGSGPLTIEDISPLAEGGFVLAGRSASGASSFVSRLDDAGNVLWWNTYSSSGGNSLFYARGTSDGGVIAGGTYNVMVGSSGTQDGWVVKLDGSGVPQWQKRFSFDQFGPDVLQFALGSLVRETPAGFAAVGISGPVVSIAGDGSIWPWLVQLGTDGTVLGQNSWGSVPGQSHPQLGAHTLETTSDGGLILAGSYGLFTSTSPGQAALFKLKPNGTCAPLDRTITAPTVTDTTVTGAADSITVQDLLPSTSHSTTSFLHLTPVSTITTLAP